LAISQRRVNSLLYPSPRLILSNQHWRANAYAKKCTIRIGPDCLIRTRCEVYNGDSYPINFEHGIAGNPHSGKDVAIDNNVFMGNNVRILKGVTIGS
jgi:acetyltransferase-like isoleucine patch superfamily enzyme